MEVKIYKIILVIYYLKYFANTYNIHYLNVIFFERLVCIIFYDDQLIGQNKLDNVQLTWIAFLLLLIFY